MHVYVSSCVCLACEGMLVGVFVFVCVFSAWMCVGVSVCVCVYWGILVYVCWYVFGV